MSLEAPKVCAHGKEVLLKQLRVITACGGNIKDDLHSVARG